LNSFADYIEKNPWIIALFLIFIGPFINFFGEKFFPRVIGIVSGLAGFTATMFFCNLFGMLDYMSSNP
jgi:hypothetical protein